MTFADLGPILKEIIAAIPKAVADYQANQARPSVTMTGAQIAAAAAQFQNVLTEAAPILAAHPGAITAADDILDALDAGGFNWAASIETGVDALPGGVDAVRRWLPTIMWALAAFQPAVIGIQGDRNDPMSPPSLPP
jgi:hypothetical protein